MPISIFAQNPEVVISVGDVTTTTFTCTFTPNANCTSYYVMAGEVGELENWVPMMGSLENVISQWGISETGTSTHTWDEMVPATAYVVYALAIGTTNVIYTDTLSTLSAGGAGASVITLSVTNIGDTSATTIATPNDQTASFKDMIVTRQLFEQQGTDSIIAMLQTDPYTYYETDTWTWLSLSPGTEYYFIAIGINSNNEWGELATFPFATTGESGIAATTAPTFHIYPNPATDYVRVSGLTAHSQLSLYDAQGRTIHKITVTNSECELSLNGLPAGLYFVAVQHQKGTSPAIQKLMVGGLNR